ncbi:MAG: DAK2 domain-containing protein [Verrucomicrobiota bacterium]
MTTIPLSDVERAVRVLAETAIANESHFSELDGLCGDGDFGTSLATGFRVVLKDWDTLDRSSVGGFLSRVGIIITSNVGGCSGPIWGTAFIRAGSVSRDKKELTVPDLAVMLRKAIEGMMARGGAQIGDKTILDALEPVAQLLEEEAARPPAPARSCSTSRPRPRTRWPRRAGHGLRSAGASPSPATAATARSTPASWPPAPSSRRSTSPSPRPRPESPGTRNDFPRANPSVRSELPSKEPNQTSIYEKIPQRSRKLRP